MKSKKIFSLLLLFALSFSVVHDYTFAILDNHSSSVEAYVAELNPNLGKHKDTLCDIHFEYHMPYTFASKSHSLPAMEKADSFFTYNETFFSLKYFNFLKPPIA